MNNTIYRLKKVLSFSEMKIVNVLVREIGNDSEKILNSNELSKINGFSRTSFVSATKLLEVAGVVETRSLGAKGTHVKVIDKELFNELKSNI